MGVFQEAKLAARTQGSPRALLPATGHHHTSKVRPEADVIALQQFVHNLFHHRNIPSGWAERQKKRVLIIPCAILARQHCRSVPCAPWHQSSCVCYRHPAHSCLMSLHRSWPAHEPQRAVRAPKPSWGMTQESQQYFGSSVAHPDS